MFFVHTIDYYSQNYILRLRCTLEFESSEIFWYTSVCIRIDAQAQIIASLHLHLLSEQYQQPALFFSIDLMGTPWSVQSTLLTR